MDFLTEIEKIYWLVLFQLNINSIVRNLLKFHRIRVIILCFHLIFIKLYILYVIKFNRKNFSILPKKIASF
jgi:hypothetical protein